MKHTQHTCTQNSSFLRAQSTHLSGEEAPHEGPDDLRASLAVRDGVALAEDLLQVEHLLCSVKNVRYIAMLNERC